MQNSESRDEHGSSNDDDTLSCVSDIIPFADSFHIPKYAEDNKNSAIKKRNLAYEQSETYTTFGNL